MSIRNSFKKHRKSYIYTSKLKLNSQNRATYIRSHNALLATTKMRQMKIAEPSIVTAHTSGSARSVFWRQSRVVTAPITTPNSPVTQVMAPKIKLEMREKCIRCQKCNVCICTLHFQRYVYVGTCLCCCMVERYSSLLSSAPPELWPGTAGSRSQTPPWQMTRPPMPEMKIHNCDYRAERNEWIC